MRTKLFALYAAVGLVLVAAGPGLVAAEDGAGNTGLSVAVNQPADGAPTVTVTDNGTGVDGAAVDVAAVDNYSYAGVGEYTTDVNGTVFLPEPQENGTIEVTATVGNRTANTTATLTAAGDENEEFGSEMAAFVHTLLLNNPSGGIGHSVATFATMNNPGNAPDHAGPPWMDDDEDERGPPAHAGPGGDENGEQGPPEQAGANGKDKGERGPPAHADRAENGDDEDGTVAEESDDGDEDEKATDDDTETDSDDEESDDDDDERGPPGGNGPPGQRGR